jgi:cytoskeleton protein RodZ
VPRYYEPMQGIGIGPALRKARLLRGKSIEEAARETRIRADYLKALERERFEDLLGDVYVRGCLRSYSTYLGLDPGKVLTVFNGHFGGPRPTLPNVAPAPIRSPRSSHPHLPQLVRHHASWAFLIGVAALVLAVFGAAGLLSRSRSAPSPEGLSGARSPIAVQAPTVMVVIKAVEPVELTVRIDGKVAFQGLLRKEEARTFEGNRTLQVELAEGRLAAVTVNGHRLGLPGQAHVPYVALFTPQSFRSSPSGNSP